MSGHNKWSTIKHKKAKTDAKRGKIFSRLSKELTLAARQGGGDITMNAQLRSAVAAAKTANMPNDNVDRAIKKGTGELDGQTLEEITYEGYGAGGVALLVEVLTDNRTRSAADIRFIFSKNNGNIANPGAVAWQFHRKARFVVSGEQADEESLMMMLLEADVDAESVTAIDETTVEIVAPPDAFAQVLTALEAADIQPSESGMPYLPDNEIEVSEVGVAKQAMRLVEALEDYDDVQGVYSNESFTDDVMATLDSDSD